MYFMIKLVVFFYETFRFSNDSSTRCSSFTCIRTFWVHACIFISGLVYRGNGTLPLNGMFSHVGLQFLSLWFCARSITGVDDVCFCVMFRLVFGLYTNGRGGRLRLPLLMCSIPFLHLSLSWLDLPFLVVVSCSLHVSCRINIYWHSLLCHLPSLVLLC